MKRLNKTESPISVLLSYFVCKGNLVYLSYKVRIWAKYALSGGDEEIK